MEGRIEVIDIVENKEEIFDDPSYTVRICLPNNEYIEVKYQYDRECVSLSAKGILEIEPQATNMAHIRSKKRT